MKIIINETTIVFPVDLLGAPMPKRSWVARADLSILGEVLTVHIFRKPFHFDRGEQIYEQEKEAKRGFTRGQFPIKRTHATSVLHHLKAAEFIALHAIPKGDYDTDVRFISGRGEDLRELILSANLRPHFELAGVKALLGG